MNKPTIMIVDNKQTLCEHLKKDLISQGFEIQQGYDQTTYGRKSRLDLVTYGYYTILFFSHRTTYSLTKYMKGK